MKLITLNIWGGNINKPLLDFVTNNKDTDIFCFQEVLNGKELLKSKTLVNAINQDHEIYEKLQNVLDTHNSYFSPCQDDEGLAIFVKKDIKVLDSGDVFVHLKLNSFKEEHSETIGRNVQFAKLGINGKILTINNFHGLWAKGGKDDSPERISQSTNIKNLLDSQTGEKILTGDFNLNPDTKSLMMLEVNLINLVRTNNIKSTRTKLYSGYEDKDLFADYILVSKNISVWSFQVLPNEVSDHSPLYLEFKI